MPVIVIDVIQDTADKISPLLSKQDFGQEISEVPQCWDTGCETFLGRDGLSDKVVADAVGLLL